MWTKHIDKTLIILHVLLNEFKRNNIIEIRRSRLKQLCNDRLFEESKGDQEDYGGSFGRCLKNLEEMRAISFKRVRKARKVSNTTVISDIPRIESLLLNKEMNDSIDMKIESRKIEDSLWEEIIVKEVSSLLDKENREAAAQILSPKLDFMDETSFQQFHSVMKETITKIASSLASRLFEFHIDHKDDLFQWDKDLMRDFGILARKISSRNPSAPFSIFIEYKGMFDGDIKLGMALGHQVFKILAESFFKWTKLLFNHDVSQEDILKISNGHTYMLSGDTKKHYDLFYDVSLKAYMNNWNASLNDVK